MNIFDTNYLAKVIGDIESPQNQDRKRKEWNNSRIYNGEVVFYTEQRLKEIFSETYVDFTKSGINLAKKVVDKLAVSYSNKPKRMLNSGDDESDFYNEILEEAGGNHIFQLFDENSVLHKYSAMQVFYDYDINDDPVIKTRALDPTQFDRVVDDFGTTKIVILSKPSENGKTQINGDNNQAIIQDEAEDYDLRVYEIYTAENFLIIHVHDSSNGLDVRIQYQEDNPNLLNHLGIIPFAFYQTGDNTKLPVSSSLGQETITVNEIMSIILTGGTLNTFGNLVIKHPADQKIPDSVSSSLFSFMKLPQLDGEAKATEADYINPQSDITSFREALAAYAISILDDHGITAGQSLKGETEHFASGLDRALAQADTSKAINKLQQSYQTVELSVFKIISRIAEVTGMYKFKSDKITVVYNKEKPLVSETEIIANITSKLTLGLITKAQAIVELEPNMTMDEAQNQIDAASKDRLSSAFGVIDRDGEV